MLIIFRQIFRSGFSVMLIGMAQIFLVSRIVPNPSDDELHFGLIHPDVQEKIKDILQ